MDRTYSDDVASLIMKIDKELKECATDGTDSQHVRDLQDRRAAYMKKLRMATVAEMEAEDETD